MRKKYDRPTTTKVVLIEKIMERMGFSHEEASFALETILELIKSDLEKGEDVKIQRFGRWSVKQKKPRWGRNPHTGESAIIRGRSVVAFLASETLRKRVNQSLTR